MSAPFGVRLEWNRFGAPPIPRRLHVPRHRWIVRPWVEKVGTMTSRLFDQAPIASQGVGEPGLCYSTFMIHYGCMVLFLLPFPLKAFCCLPWQQSSFLSFRVKACHHRYRSYTTRRIRCQGICAANKRLIERVTRAKDGLRDPRMHRIKLSKLLGGGTHHVA